jgi:hypothetical protein
MRGQEPERHGRRRSLGAGALREEGCQGVMWSVKRDSSANCHRGEQHRGERRYWDVSAGTWRLHVAALIQTCPERTLELDLAKCDQTLESYD